MLLKRIYDVNLAQASYLIGCAATGEAIVVDPNRDIDQYIRIATEEGLRVTHVTETHIHADFVSGSRELSHRTGAQLLLSDEGDADWKYAFAADAGARLLNDGDEFMVGNLKFEVMHTPGHTPEHISFLVTDTPATDKPMGAITGDFIFVGDVGRPDLLEKAANIVGTMEAGARTLFASIERFKTLPDYIQIWPGHGAGSACGKTLGSVPFSTLGYEKIANWGLAVESEDEFVRMVLDGQPEPPKYFAQMKRINKEGPSFLGSFKRPSILSSGDLAQVLKNGSTVVDTRTANAYAENHTPGTINIPLNKGFTTWAGWLVDFDRDFYLIADGGRIDQAVRDLSMIGLDRVGGYFETDAVANTRETSAIPQMDASELGDRLSRDEVTVIDVRGEAEWEAFHIPGSINVPVGYLDDRIDEIPRSKPIVVQCQGGGRSAIAASVLRASGVDEVINLSGGIAAWRESGLPVEQQQVEAGVAE